MPKKQKIPEKEKNKLYQKLMQEIIDKQIKLLGTFVAVGRAQKVKDLWVGDNGKIVQVTGSHEFALQSLINEYFKITTEAGLATCIKVIKEHLDENVDLKLPREIELLLKK